MKIPDNQRLVSARFTHGTPIPVYDDGFGPLWIHRDSMGVSGIVRARTWEDAYGITEDEFFPTAEDAREEFERIESMPEGKEMYHEQACWDEAYGYRPNGRGGPTPDKDCGIYAKDLNGEALDALTDSLIAELGIILEIETEA
jgi:hypothetical protein